MRRAFGTTGASIYIVLFLGYLLAPVLVLLVTAFNSSPYPRVWPFEGFTFKWFVNMANDAALMAGLQHSIWIAFIVVVLSVPIGMAGALVLSQARPVARTILYTLTVIPILIPGVIIGISTVIFWRQISLTAGTRVLFNGTFVTVLAQCSFISSYCMLLFAARLQQFDRAVEEAALDLGASSAQVFFHIILPFLLPTVLSATALALLSSFENYNATTFTILSEKTLTTVLASNIRLGTTPAVSALAVSIMGATVALLVMRQLFKRRRTSAAPA